jgi:hypothetical protein
VGTRIVNVADGRVPKVSALVARYATMRLAALALSALVPSAGGLFSLINVLFIFRSDRRCVHDLVAGTKVVIA